VEKELARAATSAARFAATTTENGEGKHSKASGVERKELGRDVRAAKPSIDLDINLIHSRKLVPRLHAKPPSRAPPPKPIRKAHVNAIKEDGQPRYSFASPASPYDLNLIVSSNVSSSFAPKHGAAPSDASSALAQALAALAAEPKPGNDDSSDALLAALAMMAGAPPDEQTPPEAKSPVRVSITKKDAFRGTPPPTRTGTNATHVSSGSSRASALSATKSLSPSLGSSSSPEALQLSSSVLALPGVDGARKRSARAPGDGSGKFRRPGARTSILKP
jgi:hypothetical protein